MKNFNLITAEEKAKISEMESGRISQQATRFYRDLIIEEWEKTKIADGITERHQQLLDFKDELTNSIRNKKIELKAKAINLSVEHNNRILKSLIDKNMEGVKVYNVGGDLSKKHKDFFEIPIVEEGAGTNNGHRIYSWVSKSHKSIYFQTKVSIWSEGVNEENKSGKLIYTLEDDFMTIETAAPHTEAEPVNSQEETAKAVKFLEAEKKYKKILEDLKSKCDSRIFETIKNNQPI